MAATEPPANAVAGSSEAGGFAEDVANSLAPETGSLPIVEPLPANETSDSAPLPWEPPTRPDQSADDKPTASSSAVDDLFAEPANPPASAPAMPPTAMSAPPTVTVPKVETTPPPVAAPPEVKPKPAHNTRRMAWLLGSKLSLAALANEHGAPAEEVGKWFEQAQSLAKMLGTSAAKLPAPAKADGKAAPTNPADQALGYLFTQGQQIGQDLSRKHGVEQAALFELAVKSNILLALYKPGDVVVDMLTAAIRQAGERAKLPEELYQPLLDALRQTAPAAEVRDAVFKLHADVDRYLSQADGRDSFSSREPKP